MSRFAKLLPSGPKQKHDRFWPSDDPDKAPQLEIGLLADGAFIKVSRRALLAAGLCTAAAPPAFAQAPELKITKSGDVTTIALTGHKPLQLRPTFFGSGAAIEKTDDEADYKRVEIKRIAYLGPEGTVRANLVLHFEKTGNRWDISFALNGAETASSQRPLSYFLDDPSAGEIETLSQTYIPPTQPSARLPWTSSYKAKELFLGLTRNVVAWDLLGEDGWRVALRRDMTFHWYNTRPERKYPVRFKNKGLAAQSLTFARVRPGAGPNGAEPTLAADKKTSGFGFIAHGLEGQDVFFVTSPSGDVTLQPQRSSTFSFHRWARLDASKRVVEMAVLRDVRRVAVGHDDDKEFVIPVTAPNQVRFQRSVADPHWQLDTALPLAGDKQLSLMTTAIGRIDVYVPKDTVLSLEAKGEELRKFDLTLDLRRIYRGVEGADFSTLTITQPESGTASLFKVSHADLVAADKWFDLLSAAYPHFLHVGRRKEEWPIRAKLNIDNAKLDVERARDILSLTYTFRSTDLLATRAALWINGRAGGAAPPAMAIKLPPQHVAEQAIVRPPPSKARKDKEAAQELVSDEASDPQPTPGLHDIMAARISSPSTVAFLLPDHTPKAPAAKPEIDRFLGKPGLRFALAQLTNFAELQLSVVNRAKRFDLGTAIENARKKGKTTTDHVAEATELELDHYGIEPMKAGVANPFKERLDNIGRVMQGPADFETAVELPYRLILSPDDTAHWIAPQPPEAAELVLASTDTFKERAPPRISPLWHMELVQPLDRKGDPLHGVRAVASADFSPKDFMKGAPSDTLFEGTPFEAAMNSNDRHQLVALSSMPGLPVRARKNSHPPEEKHSDEKEKDPEKELTKSVGGQITPPPSYNLHPNVDEQHGVAIYRPQPLRVSEMTLSCVGGSLTLDSAFEPPGGVDELGNDNPDLSYSIQRWRQTTVLGRDIAVELVYKGFLFPIGHRCAFVKVTERKFLPHPRGGHLTAYLVQRTFLRIGKPVKQFPAYAQPNEGRRFPASEIEILTTKTPTLSSISGPVDPKSDAVHQEAPGGRLIKCNGQVMKDVVFWPHDAITKKPFAFELRVDGGAKSVQLPLLFVSNVAVRSTEQMQALIAYYEWLGAQKEPDPRVVLEHHGTPRRYAQEEQRGEATYETEKWIMGVDSKRSYFQRATRAQDVADRLAAAPTEAEKSTIKSVARQDALGDFLMEPLMEGADQPPFYPAVATAWVRLKQVERLTGNAAEAVPTMFMDEYLEQGFTKDVNPSQIFMRTAPGVSVPLDFKKAADRAGGFGMPNAEISALSRSRGPVASCGTSAKLSDFRDFKPEMFFKDARLFGLINLSDVVAIGGNFADHAPILNELIQYSLPTESPNQIEEKVRDFVRDLRQVIKDIGDEVAVKTKDFPPGLYADLTNAAGDFEKALQDLATGQLEPSKLSKAYEKGQQLIGALNRVAADPIGPLRRVVQEQLTALNQLANSVLKVEDIRSTINTLNIDAQNKLRNEIVAGVLEAAHSGWRELVFAIPATPSELTQAGVPSFDAMFVRVLKELDDNSVSSVLPEVKVAEGIIRALETKEGRGKIRMCVVKAIEQELTNAKGRLENTLAEKEEALKASVGAARAEILEDLSRLKEQRKAIEQAAAKLVDETWMTLVGLTFDYVFKPLARLGHLVDDIRTVARSGQGLGQLVTILKDALASYGGLASALPEQLCVRAGDALMTLLTSLTPEVQKLDAGCKTAFAVPSQPVVPGVCTVPPKAPGSVVYACQLIGWSIDQLGCITSKLNESADAVKDAEASSILKKYLATVESLTRQSAKLAEELRGSLTKMQEIYAKLGVDAPNRSLVDQVKGLCTRERSLPVAYVTELAEQRLALLKLLRISLASDLKAALDRLRDVEKEITDYDGSIKSAATAAAKKQLTDAKEQLDKAIAPVRVALAAALTNLMDQAVGVLQASSGLLADAASQAAGAHAKLLQIVEQAAKDIGALAPIHADTLKTLAKEATDAKLKAATEAFRKQRSQLSKSARDALARMDNKTWFGALFQADDAGASRKDILELSEAVGQLVKTVDELLPSLKESVLDDVRQKDVEQTLFQAIARLYSLRDKVLDETVTQPLAETVLPFVERLRDIIGVFEIKLAELQTVIDGPAASPLGAVLKLMLDGDQILVSAPGIGAALRDDAKALEGIITQLKAGNRNSEALRQLRDLLLVPGLQVITLANKLDAATKRLQRGDLAGLLDLRRFKHAIEEQLRALIPSQAVLNYSLKLPLTTEHANEIGKIVAFQGDRTLVLESETRVDILHGDAPQTRVTGRFPEFSVTLLGGQLEAVKLNFNASEFTSVNGAKPALALRIKNVEIQEQLKFLQDLQGALGLGEDSNLRLDPTINPVGLRVTYGIELGTIGMGAVSFLNVNFNAGVKLPFEQREGTAATFTIALSSRDNPFLISAFPFGGGGFFGLEAAANEKGGFALTGFECSFDYGGVAAFGFGPLQGVGRLTTGLYVHKTAAGSASIEGQFYAGGSARIACFGISAALTVRLNQTGSGAMAGTAYYTFGFRLLFKKFEFTVPVWREIGKGFQRSASSSSGTRFAALGISPDSHGGIARDFVEPLAYRIMAHDICSSPVGKDLGIALVNQGHCQGQDYDQYARYFDFDLQPEM